MSEQPVVTNEAPVAAGPAIPVSSSVHLSGLADAALAEELVKIESIRDFWGRADAAQHEVKRKINNIKLAGELLDQIQQARNQMMQGRDYFDEADRLLVGVEYRLEFQQRVIITSRRSAPWILGYEIVWLLVLAALTTWISLTPELMSQTLLAGMLNPANFLNAMIWGGLGGVVGALTALWQHVAAEQDYDNQYAFWYLINPLLGAALGAFIYLVIQAGFVSMTGGQGNEQVRSAAIIYVLAWVSGFKQNVVYEIVRRILDVFRVDTAPAKEEPVTKEKISTPPSTGGVG